MFGVENERHLSLLGSTMRGTSSFPARPVYLQRVFRPVRCTCSDLGPFRVKIRTPSFNNISIVPWVMKGVYVPDVITILGSLYFILGDIDR